MLRAHALVVRLGDSRIRQGDFEIFRQKVKSDITTVALKIGISKKEKL